MPYRELARLLRGLGCRELRQRGSHHVWQCGTCVTTIPAHREGDDVQPGTLRAIEAALEPCLGQGWLKR